MGGNWWFRVRLDAGAVLFGVLVLSVWGLFSFIFVGGWVVNVVVGGLVIVDLGSWSLGYSGVL